MKTYYKFLWIIVLSFIIFSSCNENMSDPTSVSSNQNTLLKGSGPSATGQGRIEGTDRVFAFNAVTHNDGSVTGQGQLTYTHNGNDIRIHFSIDCISVNNNVATMSGTVTSVTGLFQGNPPVPFQPGGPCWFRVVDNGEGGNAPPDEMTGFLLCDPNDPNPQCEQLSCGNDIQLGLNPIENGNIQVRE